MPWPYLYENRKLISFLIYYNLAQFTLIAQMTVFGHLCGESDSLFLPSMLYLDACQGQKKANRFSASFLTTSKT